LVDAHAANAAAPDTGLLWVARRAGASSAPDPLARCAAGAPSHNPAVGHSWGAPS